MSVRQLSHPFVSSLVVLGALGVVGFVALTLTWRGAAAEAVVTNQLPYLVSGGIGGGALVGFAFGVWMIQHRRMVEAQRRAQLDQAVETAAELLAVARRKAGGSQ